MYSGRLSDYTQAAPRPGKRQHLTDRTASSLAAVAVAAAVAAWIVYLREGLVLSHYDARAHLVVARRVIDSLTPGWQQLGALWLPLPHLINLLPAQIDFFYRTGAFASLVSIACFGVTAWALARLVLEATGSRAGAVVAAGLLVLNPNILYLQVTPMTEPLLLATSALAVLWLFEWVNADRNDVPTRLGLMLFAAVWTRYEAWAIAAAALAAAAVALRQRGRSWRVVAHRMGRLARWPAAAVLLFMLISRITVGAWLVSGGFYVPDPTYAGQAWKTAVGIWWGVHRLSGYATESIALVTAGWVLVRALVRPADAALAVPVALFAAAALPFAAFYQAHPYRIRYMVPVVVACALFAGLAAGTAGRAARWFLRSPYVAARAPAIVAIALIASALVESPPWRARPPLFEDAQSDAPASVGRRAVTRCLAESYRGEKVLASMGSLAHYMQELSHAGLDIADFIHEGNGVIWELALETGPLAHAGWMLIEEEAEGGDVLARRVRHAPEFARGMTRVCEGGGVALYRAE